MLLRPLFFLLWIGASASFGACKDPNIVDSDRAQITESRLAIVTHASSAHDKGKKTAQGMNRMVKRLKSLGAATVYLQDYKPIDTYFYEDCEPDYYIHHGIGHHQLSLDSVDAVYLAGGYFGLCFRNTLKDVFESFYRSRNQRLRVFIVRDAVFGVGEYFEGHESKAFYRRWRDHYDTYGSNVTLETVHTITGDPKSFISVVEKQLPMFKAGVAVHLKVDEFEKVWVQPTTETQRIEITYLPSSAL